jgi:hypothetical protein
VPAQAGVLGGMRQGSYANIDIPTDKSRMEFALYAPLSLVEVETGQLAIAALRLGLCD